MAIRQRRSESRPAQTFYEVLERFDALRDEAGCRKDRPDAPDSGSLNHIGCRCSAIGSTGQGQDYARRKSAGESGRRVGSVDRQHCTPRLLRHPLTGLPLEVEAPLRPT